MKGISKEVLGSERPNQSAEHCINFALEKLDKLADETGESRNQIIRSAIEEYLKKGKDE